MSGVKTGARHLLVRKAGMGLYVSAVAVAAAALTVHVWRINRQHRYDELIREVAAEHGLDAWLLRRLVERESGFRPRARGSRGEIGLAQVTIEAAQDWATAHGCAPPSPEELFEPVINLRVGAWYLARALEYWRHRECPEAYALAEYNAGRSNAMRWAQNAEDADAFLRAITYPSTRRYVRDILRDQ